MQDTVAVVVEEADVRQLQCFAVATHVRQVVHADGLLLLVLPLQLLQANALANDGLFVATVKACCRGFHAFQRDAVVGSILGVEVTLIVSLTIIVASCFRTFISTLLLIARPFLLFNALVVFIQFLLRTLFFGIANGTTHYGSSSHTDDSAPVATAWTVADAADGRSEDRAEPCTIVGARLSGAATAHHDGSAQ